MDNKYTKEQLDNAVLWLLKNIEENAAMTLDATYNPPGQEAFVLGVIRQRCHNMIELLEATAPATDAAAGEE